MYYGSDYTYIAIHPFVSNEYSILLLVTQTVQVNHKSVMDTVDLWWKVCYGDTTHDKKSYIPWVIIVYRNKKKKKTIFNCIYSSEITPAIK